MLTGPQTGTPTAARSFEPVSINELRDLFPHLEIIELVGRGGMGAVYKVRQPRLERLAALKILPLELDCDPSFAERFTREAKALARLNHPNIVSIYDSGQREGLFYFLMEFVDGVNLRELERSRRLTAEEAMAIVPPVCEALEYAHRQGIVHRDVKPENILIDTTHRVKIADFGIAKLLNAGPEDRSLTQNTVVGTPHYMAPEQVEKPGAVDHRADIYSLGVVFYELLTGELPLGKFPLPSKAGLDARLDTVVLRALEKEPKQRYQHASEFKTQLEALTSSPGHSAKTPQRLGWRTRLAILLAVIGVAAGLSWTLLHRPEAPRTPTLNQQPLDPGTLGWFLAGSHPSQYETRLDPAVTHNGQPSRVLRSTVPEARGFATAMQMFKPVDYRGRRLRMSGYVKVEAVAGQAFLWMRVDGAPVDGSETAEPLAFDNMHDRVLRGTSQWTACSIVLDVGEQASEVAFGMSLAGAGKFWLADLQFEVVDKTVPVTGASNAVREPLEAPNLDFGNQEPQTKEKK